MTKNLLKALITITPWATAATYQETTTEVCKMKDQCECSDPGCPVHSNQTECTATGIAIVLRIDMEDETGTLMCEDCASDAMKSGVFTVKDNKPKGNDMTNWNLFWAPTGQCISTVKAKTARAAIRKAKLPWRRFLGEIYAVEVTND